MQVKVSRHVGAYIDLWGEGITHAACIGFQENYTGYGGPFTVYLARNEHGTILGAIMYSMENVDGGVLRSCGSAVKRHYRGRGIARKLWQAVLNDERPARVYAYVVSNHGKTLMQSLKRRFRCYGIKWDIVEDDDRQSPLRVLNKKRRAA